MPKVGRRDAGNEVTLCAIMPRMWGGRRQAVHLIREGANTTLCGKRADGWQREMLFEGKVCPKCRAVNEWFNRGGADVEEA